MAKTVNLSKSRVVPRNACREGEGPTGYHQHCVTTNDTMRERANGKRNDQRRSPWTMPDQLTTHLDAYCRLKYCDWLAREYLRCCAFVDGGFTRRMIGYMQQEEEWDREGLLDPAWEKQQKKPFFAATLRTTKVCAGYVFAPAFIGAGILSFTSSNRPNIEQNYHRLLFLIRRLLSACLFIRLRSSCCRRVTCC
ncbi:unnamed protein product [Soboliphyme baturini]|uniref:Uncharacterized protein n=1 Tax=Soboliphyme baturini TaxID=241478 RepID=A0A183IJS3_9BILA|nr:unnamed protein product [Soboliphyme baturini]